MADKSYDAVVIGGGHHGTIIAPYLAKAGLTVGVFERLDHLGGGVLQVDALGNGVSGDEDADLRSLELQKDLLSLPLVQATVDRQRGGIGVALVAADLLRQVVHRVHIPGKYHHLGVGSQPLAEGRIQQFLQLAVAA